MSLSTALFASVTGLDTTSTAISVIGDNIANVGTPGFKERRAEFADVLGQSVATSGGFSQTGAGAKVQRVSQIFSQGSFESTDRVTDLALEGRGFFIMDGAQGRSYTRAGIFTFDNEGVLKDSSDRRVQGISIDPLTLLETGQLGDITLNTALSPPQVSTEWQLSVNLDSNRIAGAAFDPSDPFGTSEFSSSLNLHDSLGNPHQTTIYFTKTGANAWAWNAGLEPAETTTAPATAGDPTVIQGGGTLTFDTDGVLTAATGSPVTFEFSGGSAPGQVVDINFGPIAGVGTGDPTTQYAEQSVVNSGTQNGFSAGTLQGVEIDRDGFVTGTFSNGESRPLARMALAIFPNVEGLSAVGNNQWVESRGSGQPLVGTPQTGQFGAVRSSNIEQSNVDLAAQFIRLIMNQRAFQANTRTVSTTNELLANLVQLGQ